MLSSWESPHSGCLILEGLITQYLLGQESGYLRSFSLSPKPWRIPGERWSSVNNGSLEMIVLRSLKKSVRRIDKLGGAKGGQKEGPLCLLLSGLLLESATHTWGGSSHGN